MKNKSHEFWVSIDRDPFDYRRGDIVEYKGKRLKVNDRHLDRVDLAFQGLSVSRYSGELRLVKEYRHRYIPKTREHLSNLYYHLVYRVKYKSGL